MADSVIVQEAAMDTFDPLLCQKGTDVWPARRSRMLAVVAGTLLITAVATFGILLVMSDAKDTRESLQETSLDSFFRGKVQANPKWERDNHLALNSALEAVQSAARAQQLVQLPKLALLSQSVPQPLVHSWEPPDTQQLSSFQKWLAQEQSKIRKYVPRQSIHRTHDRFKFGKPMHFDLPTSVANGLSAVQKAQAELSRKQEEVVPPGFRLACFQEVHGVGPCESLPYKPLKKWYSDYRNKGKYSADLLWDRSHKLKSESANQKTWDEIKRESAKRTGSSSDHWFRWRKSMKGRALDDYYHASPGAYSYSRASKHDDDGSSFSWPDEGDKGDEEDSGDRGDEDRGDDSSDGSSRSDGSQGDGRDRGGASSDRGDEDRGDDSSDGSSRSDGSQGDGRDRGGASSSQDDGRNDDGIKDRPGSSSDREGAGQSSASATDETDEGAASGSRASSSRSSAPTGGETGAESERPVIVNAPAPVIDKALASSIHGLADMVKELSGMLTHWQPNVTVQTVPVDVKVAMPTPKNWGSVWKAAEGVLKHEEEESVASKAGATQRSSSADSASSSENADSTAAAAAKALGEKTPHPVRVLQIPLLQPGGGVFDGGVQVNISAGDEDYSAVDGNASAPTVVHYMISASGPVPAYETFPMVKQDILQTGNETEEIHEEEAKADAEAGGNTSVTVQDFDERGDVFREPLSLEPGSVVVSAYVSREGWEDSPVVSQQYDVIECGDDKCCQWSVVYMRVRRLLDKLMHKNETLSRDRALAKSYMQQVHSEWLRSNSRYEGALMRVKDEKEETEFALGKQEMWQEAVRGSLQMLNKVKSTVRKHLDDLQQERALITWILKQLETTQLSPAAALGRVEQSLTDVTGSDTMGDLQKILVAAKAHISGRGRVHGEQLQALERGDSPSDSDDIAAILREMITDLKVREQIFEGMLAKAQMHQTANTVKAKEWDTKLSRVASDVEESRATISEEQQRREVLAGKLLVAQQAVESDDASFSGQHQMLSASIASYTRVIKTIRAKAQGTCASVKKAEQNVELEEDQIQRLMSKIKRTPASSLSPKLREQMTTLQELASAESKLDGAQTSSAPTAPMLQTQTQSTALQAQPTNTADPHKSELINSQVGAVWMPPTENAPRLRAQPRGQGL